MDGKPRHLESKRIEILGVPVDQVDMQSVLARSQAMLTRDETHVIAAINPEKVIAAQRDPKLLHALNEASLVIPDGIGIVAAARLLGKGHIERVAGADLMPELCRIAAANGHSVFLFGAKSGVANRAATLLRSRYPGLEIAGVHHGYVAEDEMDRLIAKINASNANALFVGLGSPKQEFWMARHRHCLNVRICQGVGGTFDAICGNVHRAPAPIQKLYLEWLYRLIREPQRWRRQRALPNFVFQVFRQAIIGR